MPVECITVRAVCEAAGCNRSTFYRNFASTYAVLDAIEERALPLEMPTVLRRALSANSAVGLAAMHAFAAANHARIDRLCLLLSSHGDPAFAARMRTALAHTWVEGFGGRVDELSPQATLLVEFLMRGISGLLAYRGDNGNAVDLDAALTFFSEEVAPVLVPLLERTVAQGGSEPAVAASELVS
jgi:AcrR family transcriptional regulator